MRVIVPLRKLNVENGYRLGFKIQPPTKYAAALTLNAENSLVVSKRSHRINPRRSVSAFSSPGISDYADNSGAYFEFPFKPDTNPRRYSGAFGSRTAAPGATIS